MCALLQETNKTLFGIKMFILFRVTVYSYSVVVVITVISHVRSIMLSI